MKKFNDKDADNLLTNLGLDGSEKDVRVEKIIKLYVGGKLPEELDTRVLRWLAADWNAERKEAELKKLWDRVDGEKTASTHKALAKVLNRLDFPKGEIRKATAHRHRRLALRVAAAVIPVAFVAAYFLTRPQEQPVVVAQAEWFGLEVAEGTTDSLTLADGTRLILNGGTSITYPDTFEGSDERRVKLTGEAFFDVTGDSKPFVVETNDITVRVLGTQFNVNAYPEDRMTSVSLLEGAVEADIGSGHIRMKELEQVELDRETNEVITREIDRERTLAWTRGELNFERRKLDEIFRMVERHYGVSIQVDGPMTNQTEFSTWFTAEDDIVSAMVVIQSMTYQFTFEIEGDTIFVKMR